MKFLSRLFFLLGALACWPQVSVSQGYPNPILSTDIRAWGCSVALADNGPCINKAITNNPSGTVYIKGGLFKVTTPIVASTGVDIVGESNAPGVYNSACVSGLVQSVANIDLLTLTNGGSVSNLCITQASGVTNSAGHGLYSLNSVSTAGQTRFENNQVNGACYGIAFTGTGGQQNVEPIAIGNTVIPAANANCAGFRIGELTTGGNTVDVRLTNNSVYCGNNLPTALLVNDSGGIQTSNNVFGYQCNVGTQLLPGANQSIIWSQFGVGPAGDTDNVHDVSIDTASSSATMFGNYFNGTWGSNAQTGANVYVRNTAGAASLSGLYFKHFIAYVGPGATGFDFGGSWANIHVESSTICSTNANNSSNVGIAIGGSVSQFSILGNKIGACESFNGTPNVGTGISITSSATDLGIVSGNTFGNASNPTTNPIVFAPTGTLNFLHYIQTNNKGVDDFNTSPIATTSNISLPIYPIIYTTGAGTVTNLSGAIWPGREVTIRHTSADSMSFATGGSGTGVMCAPASIGQFQQVTATYDPGNNCWWIAGGTQTVSSVSLPANGVIYVGGVPSFSMPATNFGGNPAYGPNTVVGYNAGLNLDPGAIEVTLLGQGAGGSGLWAANNPGAGIGGGTGLTGVENTFVGWLAGTQMTTGQGNTAVGNGAEGLDIGGQFNTSIGHDSMRNSIGGLHNTALGANAGRNDSGQYNVFLGDSSAFGTDPALGQPTSTTGTQNTGAGASSLQQITTGSSNVAVGKGAGYGVTTQSNNTYIGTNGGQFNTGANNVTLGYLALGASGSTGSNLVALGAGALSAATTGNNNTAVGKGAAAVLTTGGTNTIIGNNVASTTLTLGNRNIYLGTASNCDGATNGESDTLRICMSTGSTSLISGSLVAASPSLALGANTSVAGYVKTNVLTVATLASCAAGTSGARSMASDLSGATYTFGAAAAGGGTRVGPVFCDGTSWREG